MNMNMPPKERWAKIRALTEQLPASVHVTDTRHGRVTTASPDVAALGIVDGLSRLSTDQEIEAFQKQQEAESRKLQEKADALIPRAIIQPPKRKEA